MTHGSLFSGIGGCDLAATWAGWENIFQVEIDPWCQRILQKHFPDAKRFSDIREFDGSAWRGSVDVISGGFPCQPYSSAGKRLGKEDERHLWPEMLRVIREAAPRWIVGENVRGLVSWSGGLVFEEVCADLEASGYEVQPFVLPAASVGAPHQRQRVWFVAYAERIGQQGQGRAVNAFGSAKSAKRQADWTYNDVRWPTQPPVCGTNDGLSDRMDRIRGLGNAVVPQVVYRIFDTINKFEI